MRNWIKATILIVTVAANITSLVFILLAREENKETQRILTEMRSDQINRESRYD